MSRRLSRASCASRRRALELFFGTYIVSPPPRPPWSRRLCPTGPHRRLRTGGRVPPGTEARNHLLWFGVERCSATIRNDLSIHRRESARRGFLAASRLFTGGRSGLALLIRRPWATRAHFARKSPAAERSLLVRYGSWSGDSRL